MRTPTDEEKAAWADRIEIVCVALWTDYGSGGPWRQASRTEKQRFRAVVLSGRLMLNGRDPYAEDYDPELR